MLELTVAPAPASSAPSPASPGRQGGGLPGRVTATAARWQRGARGRSSGESGQRPGRRGRGRGRACSSACRARERREVERRWGWRPLPRSVVGQHDERVSHPSQHAGVRALDRRPNRGEHGSDLVVLVVVVDLRRSGRRRHPSTCRETARGPAGVHRAAVDGVGRHRHRARTVVRLEECLRRRPVCTAQAQTR
jgi:hypothetical protein